MRKFIILTSVLALTAAPASAQLLGGSGGGAGGLGGSLGGTIGRTTGTVTTAGTGTARTSGTQSADRRSGRVRADRRVEGSGSGSVDGVVQRGARTTTGTASGQGSGSADGSADAQLIGTDAVRPLATSAVSGGRSLAAETAGTVRGATGMATATASSAAGAIAANGSAMGQSAFSGAAGQLALAGSAAGNAAGTFDLSPGMDIVNQRGRVIGDIEQVLTDSRGRVQAVLVDVEGSEEDALIPAANFTGSGNLLVSAMGRGALEEMAENQAEASPADASSEMAGATPQSNPEPAANGAQRSGGASERNANVRPN